MSAVITTPGVEHYTAAFLAERERDYPSVGGVEATYGYHLSRDAMEEAARVLACPVKANPPNWQHGRVLYAVARKYLASQDGPVSLLDIGTAKGYSALCLQWALRDSGKLGAVVSVDVLDPKGTERRNSILEVDGPKTLTQFHAQWPEFAAVTFLKSTGVEWLVRHPARVHLCFVDGKHSGAVVWQEGTLLAARQQPGDVVVFDDVQIDGVGTAVKELKVYYEIELVQASESRCYAIGVRRG